MAYFSNRTRSALARRLRQRLQRVRAAERPVARPRIDQEQRVLAKKMDAPEIEIPWRIRVAAAWSWRVLLLLAVATVVGLLLIKLRAIVVPLALAIFLTVFLLPFANLLKRRLRFPSMLAAISTVALFLGVVGTLFTFAGRNLAFGFAGLRDKVFAAFDTVLKWLSDGPLGIAPEEVEQWVTQFEGLARANASKLASGALSVTTSVGQLIAGVFLVVFLLIFFLHDGRRLWVWFVRLMPRPWREPLHEASIRGFVTLRGYVQSTMLVALIDAIGIGVGAWALGLPFPLAIGVLVFLGSFVPIIGAVLSGAVACLVAFVDKDLTTALIMLAIVLIVQQVEANVLQPIIMGNLASLHPVAVVLGVTGGTYLAGITGAVFAVPAMAFINSFLLYLSGHDQLPQLATNQNRPGGPPGALDDLIFRSFGYNKRPEAGARPAGESGN